MGVAEKSYSWTKMMKKKSVRKLLRSSASLIGLAAGAVGWSSVARAETEDSQVQTLLLPEHYHQSDDGLVTFSLQTGEQLTLNPEQYVILQDGLLLITDEIAQASMQSLPVMGSIRAQLSDLEQVATIDSIVAEATPAQTLAITEGRAPRLFEEVDIERFELAQATGENTETPNASWQAIDGGLVAGGFLAALALRSNSPESEENRAESNAGDPSSNSPPPAPEFWTDAMIADMASTSVTGSLADSFIGYTAASTTATKDPLTDVGKGTGNVATFDMSAGGNNYFVAGHSAASSFGALSYTGGPGNDTLEFGHHLAIDGSATFDMRAGGTNTFYAASSAALRGNLTYKGGNGPDNLTFGYAIAQTGSATIDFGNDSVSDSIAFTAGEQGDNGSFIIQNFDPTKDTISFTETFTDAVVSGTDVVVTADRSTITIQMGSVTAANNLDTLLGATGGGIIT